MQKAGSLVYWFCSAVAIFLALFGLWDTLLGQQGRVIPILLCCLGVAATFYLARSWARQMSRRAAENA